MTHVNLTMLGGAAVLFSGAGNQRGAGVLGGAGSSGTGAGMAGVLPRDPASFNYSIHHAPGHIGLPGSAGIGNGTGSLLHKLLSNVSSVNAIAAAASSAVGGLLDSGGGGYDLAGNLTPCAITNDTLTGGAVVIGLACNFSLAGDNGNASVTGNNPTSPPHPNPYSLIQLMILAFLAGTTCIATIIGNLIVILSFIIERTIRQPTNYFIASLAVSDLLIGTFSMPFYTVYLLTGKYWPLGELVCDLWLSVDYTVCLTSIYTVFCITIDRFCSVKIPAKYRAWRTDTKVKGVITLTWVIPILVFFTSIFGWQYFVGRRTVPEGMCYVQYMEDALFNCVLQLGYFWVTLTVMCVLYTGIYKVALDLQRKSEAKQKKMTSLVSMAGQTMTKIGIGMSKHQTIGSKSVFERSDQGAKTSKTDGAPNTLEPGHSTTSFNKQEKDEDRSSSPAFPSDTDQSSQSPKHNKPLRAEGKNNNKVRTRKRQGRVSNGERKVRRGREAKREVEEAGRSGSGSRSGSNAVVAPGRANSAFTETVENNAPTPIVGNSLSHATRPFDVKRGSVSNHSVIQSPTTTSPGSGAGSVSISCGLAHNSVAPLPPAAPLTIDSVQAANIHSEVNHPLIDEPGSPSSMENMPSTSPPPYPSLFPEAGEITPAQSDDFSFPPPPQVATYCGSDGSVGGGVVIVGGCIVGAHEQCGMSICGREGLLPSSPCSLGDRSTSVPNSPPGNISSVPHDSVISYPSPMRDFDEVGHTVTMPPEFISGIMYIDQDSLKSPLSTDNMRFLAEDASSSPLPKEQDSLVVEEPESPVWKRRSLVERETRNSAVMLAGPVVASRSSPIFTASGIHLGGAVSVCSAGSAGSAGLGGRGGRHGSGAGVGIGGVMLSSGESDNGCDDDDDDDDDDFDAKGSPIMQNEREPMVPHDNVGTSNNNSSGTHRLAMAAGAHIQVESRHDSSKTISRLAKPDEIQPLNAEDPHNSHAEDSLRGSGKRAKGKAGSPLRGLIKSVGSRKFKRTKKDKPPKSKSENRARRALRVITIILGAFVICWTPWHILSMIIGFCPESSGCVEATLYDISYWLCYLNSPINPLCYAFANQQFKKTFLRILRLDWHRT